jgi:FKBP-type peptidyl-prolyl cis-trans isomerase FkpA
MNTSAREVNRANRRWPAPWWLMLLTVLPGVGAANPTDDNGIPGLLQFAEKYNESPQPALPTATSPTQKKKSTAPTTTLSAREDRQRDHRLQQQQHDKIVALEQQVARLTVERDAAVLKAKTEPVSKPQVTSPTTVPPDLPDLAGLRHLVQGMRQAIGVTLSEQQAKDLVARARAREVAADEALREARHQNQSLQQQLASYRQQHDAANKALLAVDERRDALKKQLASLQQEQSTWKSDLAAAQALIKQGRDSDTALRKELGHVTARADKVQSALDVSQAELVKNRAEHKTPSSGQGQEPAVRLDDDINRQSYAAGVTLSRDIQSLQDEHRGWGVTVNEQALLAGIMDGVTGSLRLTPEALSWAQASADAALNNARVSVMKRQQEAGDKYLAEFKRQTGVKESPQGFWYRIDYLGDAPIAEGAVVSVVVKESLTDGTVVQDMETSDRVLSQPLQDFPPLFQAAIKELKNHGALTMVVPPALAYGEKGYPPKVPPNATVVYTLRIDDAYVIETSPAKKL